MERIISASKLILFSSNSVLTHVEVGKKNVSLQKMQQMR